MTDFVKMGLKPIFTKSLGRGEPRRKAQNTIKSINFTFLCIHSLSAKQNHNINNMKEIIIIFFGGGLGSTLRYWLAERLGTYYLSNFPFGIFVTNILGCFLIGVFSGYLSHHPLLNKEWKLLLIVGFCGGFTTFSTFSHDNLTLIEAGLSFNAVINIIASVAIGIIAVWAGNALIR